jgi:apolipoprotein N-acyltransferase
MAKKLTIVEQYEGIIAKVEGVLTAEVELRTDKTTYTIYGDWIARISTFVAVLTLLYFVAYRIRKRNHLVD